MNTNHYLVGDIESSTEGFSGQTLLIAANAAAGHSYPYPEGIEVEFEVNGP